MKKSILTIITLLLSFAPHMAMAGSTHLYNKNDTNLYNNQILKSPLVVNFPEDLDSESERSALENITLKFTQTLYVTNTYYWQKYGQVSLSSKRLYTPTEIHAPASADYREQVANNTIDKITLDDGSNQSYPSPLPWTDEDGTIRTGMMVDNLIATLKNTEYGWVLIPQSDPYFYGNSRPSALPNLHDDEIRVCGFNLEHYIVSNFGSGFGPENQDLSNKQHNKISKALVAINADIYALCEVQTGQDALQKLTHSLNQAAGAQRFAFINDGSTTNGSYSKVGYIYRSDKFSPLKNIKENDFKYDNRKKAQGFSQKSNGGSFILMMNHFKAKSGTGYGEDADQNDGQGTYNRTRTLEAESTVNFAKQCTTYYNDKDILILGDLNSNSMEDPIQVLVNANYTNLIYKFSDNNTDKYTYVYKGQVGCLDHAFANENMLSQITNTYVYHINTDEPSMFGYDNYNYSNDMYRCSDHDPVIVEMKLNATDTSIQKPELNVIFNHANKDIFTINNARNHYMDIYNYNGVMVYKNIIKENSQSFNISNVGLKSGVYIIKLTETKIIQPRTTILKLLITKH